MIYAEGLKVVVTYHQVVSDTLKICIFKKKPKKKKAIYNPTNPTNAVQPQAWRSVPSMTEAPLHASFFLKKKYDHTLLI